MWTHAISLCFLQGLWAFGSAGIRETTGQLCTPHPQGVPAGDILGRSQSSDGCTATISRLPDRGQALGINFCHGLILSLVLIPSCCSILPKYMHLIGRSCHHPKSQKWVCRNDFWAPWLLQATLTWHIVYFNIISVSFMFPWKTNMSFGHFPD